ncbi:MAG: hypothetical protein QM724_01640 [Flavobacteriales bacterium]
MDQRYLLILLSSLGALGAAQAQTGYTRTHNRMFDEAHGLYEAEQWVEASKIYKRLLPVDTAFADVYYEMGMCEINIPGQRDKAGPHFEQAVRHGSNEARYQLALQRHRQQRFDEEVALLKEYRTGKDRTADDREVDRRIAMANSARTLTAAPVPLRIRNMGNLINSSAHDYCPIVTADGNTMYLTSRREGTTGGFRDPGGQYFEDIYMARRIDDVWSNATNVGKPLNTYVQDATVGLSPDGNEMIVYRTSQDLVSGDLLLTKKVDGLWQTPERMTDRINSDAHEPSATISPDGSEIYFTSDRAGGYGGRDLYRIRRLPNGEWSQPLNLGPTVNTPYDEDAPFIHSDGTTLFFSSNGHNTMGGYDIFKATLVDPDMNVWGKPENMGYPLNTVNDDIYFCLSEDGETGYFSSERPGGLGGQDIYQVVFPNSQIDYLLVRGVVTDANEEPVKARITLTDAAGEEIVGVYNSNERTGRYVMVVKPDDRLHMTVQATGFDEQKNDVVAKRPTDGTREMRMDVQLVRNDRTAGAQNP